MERPNTAPGSLYTPGLSCMVVATSVTFVVHLAQVCAYNDSRPTRFVAMVIDLLLIVAYSCGLYYVHILGNRIANNKVRRATRPGSVVSTCGSPRLPAPGDSTHTNLSVSYDVSNNTNNNNNNNSTTHLWKRSPSVLVFYGVSVAIASIGTLLSSYMTGAAPSLYLVAIGTIALGGLLGVPDHLLRGLAGVYTLYVIFRSYDMAWGVISSSSDTFRFFVFDNKADAADVFVWVFLTNTIAAGVVVTVFVVAASTARSERDRTHRTFVAAKFTSSLINGMFLDEARALLDTDTLGNVETGVIEHIQFLCDRLALFRPFLPDDIRKRQLSPNDAASSASTVSVDDDADEDNKSAVGSLLPLRGRTEEQGGALKVEIGVTMRPVIVATIHAPCETEVSTSTFVFTVGQNVNNDGGRVHGYRDGHIVVFWVMENYPASDLPITCVMRILAQLKLQHAVVCHAGVDLSPVGVGTVGKAGSLLFRELRGAAVEGSMALCQVAQQRFGTNTNASTVLLSAEVYARLTDLRADHIGEANYRGTPPWALENECEEQQTEGEEGEVVVAGSTEEKRRVYKVVDKFQM